MQTTHLPPGRQGALLNSIVAELERLPNCKQIRPFDLQELGYQFAKQRLVVADTAYEIHEILDADTKRRASFCFLLSKKLLLGVVLGKRYEHYERIASEDSARPADNTWQDSYTPNIQEVNGTAGEPIDPPANQPNKNKRKRKGRK